ncbi:MAG: peptidylprolyl isomerase [Vulcanimicrobiota bacterium]
MRWLLLLLLSLPVWAGPIEEIEALEHSRRPPGPPLTTYLDHADPAVRARATVALGRLQNPKAIPLLVKALRDPEPAVQEEAAFALGQVPAEAEVLAELGSAPMVIKPLLVEAALKMGGADTLALLPGWLDEPELASTAALGAGRYSIRRKRSRPDLPAVDEASLSRLRKLVASPDLETARNALYALTAAEDAGAAPRALEALERQAMGLSAARYFGAVTYPQAGPGLRKLQSHKMWRIRAAAAKALARIEDIEATRAALDDPSAHVRQLASAGLGPWALPLLPQLVDDPQALAQVLGAQAMPYLGAHSRALDWRTRKATASALATFPEATPLLVRLLHDPDRRVAEAALEAATKFKPEPRLRAAVLTYLRQRDLALTPLAADVIATWQDVQALPDLLEAIDFFTAQDDSETVQGMLTALGSLKDPRARARLEQAARSADANLAGAARKALGQPAPTVPGAAPHEPVLRSGELPARARITTEKGSFVIAFFGPDAPRTVANFAHLAASGFWTGNQIHRVVPDFVVQAGCPRSDGWGGPGYTIGCEINRHPYRRGTVGMALAGKDTGGSQFFICHSRQPRLDGNYTVFGQVEEGMEVVDRLQVGDHLLSIELQGESGQVWKPGR